MAMQVMLVGIRIPCHQDFLTAAGLKGKSIARGNGGREGLDKLPVLVVFIEGLASFPLSKRR
jgi:hypothetical protein